MNIKILVLLIMTLSLNSINAQQKKEEWLFVGYLVEEEVGCTNKAFTGHEVIFLKKDGTQKDKRTTFETAFVKRHNLKVIWPTITVLIEPGKQVLIALIEKTRKCSNGKTVTSLGFYSGETREALDKKIAADLKNYKEITAYTIKKLWNNMEEIKL